MHPHLDYLCTVWGSATPENQRKLFQQQKHAARLLFDDWDSSYSELFSELNSLPIDRRIVHSKLILVYKTLHNMCPQYFAEMVQYQRNNVYNMRSTAQMKLLVPWPKCETFTNRFSYSEPHLWNKPPYTMHQAQSLNEFMKLALQHTICIMSSPSTAYYAYHALPYSTAYCASCLLLLQHTVHHAFP